MLERGRARLRGFKAYGEEMDEVDTLLALPVRRKVRPCKDFNDHAALPSKDRANPIRQ